MNWDNIRDEFLATFQATIGHAVKSYGTETVKDIEQLGIDFFEQSKKAAAGDEESRVNLLHLLGQLKIIGATTEALGVMAGWDFVAELGKKGMAFAAAFVVQLLAASFPD